MSYFTAFVLGIVAAVIGTRVWYRLSDWWIIRRVDRQNPKKFERATPADWEQALAKGAHKLPPRVVHYTDLDYAGVVENDQRLGGHGLENEALDE